MVSYHIKDEGDCYHYLRVVQLPTSRLLIVYVRKDVVNKERECQKADLDNGVHIDISSFKKSPTSLL